MRFSVEILKATLKYWRKHYGPIGQATCNALLVMHHGIRFLIRALKNLVGLGRSPGSQAKLQEDVVCLRWLLLRIDVGDALTRAPSQDRPRHDAT